MWPLTPEEARLLAGLNSRQFMTQVKHLTGTTLVAPTSEGANVLYTERGTDSEGRPVFGFGLAGSTPDGSDARRALRRLRAMLNGLGGH